MPNPVPDSRSLHPGPTGGPQGFAGKVRKRSLLKLELLETTNRSAEVTLLSRWL